MSMPTHFGIRYGLLRWLLVLLGMGPRLSGVEVGPETMKVRMGWAFRAAIPIASITSARRTRNAWGGIGVHGWRGRWLVNGSVRGIVAIEIDPWARARVMGWPVKLRSLYMSLDTPDEFLAAVER